MSSQLPSEIVVERFLPTRAMLATELEERGLTQQEIADWLGVTQAAMGTYVSGTATVESRFQNDPRLQQTITSIAAGIATESMDEYEVLGELSRVIHEFENRGSICEIHGEEMPSLQEVGCDLCVRGFDRDTATERAVVATVRKEGRLLADSPGIVDGIPNIGTNIGMALPGAADERDVAAIPDRIHAMCGRLTIPSNPEFGASQHVAQILTAMQVDAETRGALDLATVDRVLDAANER